MSGEDTRKTPRVLSFEAGEYWRGPGTWIVLFLLVVNVVVGLWRDDLIAQRRENLLIDGADDAPKLRSDSPKKTVRYEMSVGEIRKPIGRASPGVT